MPGDGAVAARRSKLARPPLTIRLDPIVLALVRLVAASQARSVNALVEESVNEWIKAYCTALNQRTNGTVSADTEGI